MTSIHRGTATSPHPVFTVKPSKIPVTPMNSRSPALCVPFQQVARRLVSEPSLLLVRKRKKKKKATHTKKPNQPKEKEKLKLPPTILRAHIAMMTSTSTTPFSSICLS